MQKHRFKVQVKKTCMVDVDVLAEDEMQARKKAEVEARYGYREVYGEIMEGLAILASGPADEPLIKIPETWEIYSSDDYEKPAKIANAKITAAVRMACADMLARHKKNEDVGPEFASKCWDKYIKPVFKKYEKLGTGDTEPRANVANVMSKYAAWTGADGEQVYEALRWR